MWVKDTQWSNKDSLSECLALFAKDRWKGSFHIYVIGSGGKTTLIETLAKEQQQCGKKVLILTTTHMGLPKEYGVLLEGQSLATAVKEIEDMLSESGIAVAGVPKGRGITWVGDELYEAVAGAADIFLIEADGSRRHPVKVPAPYEPVIRSDADLIVAVSGMSAIGKTAGEKCHRLPFADRIRRHYRGKPLTEATILTAEDLICFMEEGYLSPIRRKFLDVPVIPVFNQADQKQVIEQGREMIEKLRIPMGMVGSVRCPKGTGE